MIATFAADTEMQNNFGKYLRIVMQGNEVIETCSAKTPA